MFFLIFLFFLNIVVKRSYVIYCILVVFMPKTHFLWHMCPFWWSIYVPIMMNAAFNSSFLFVVYFSKYVFFYIQVLQTLYKIYSH